MKDYVKMVVTLLVITAVAAVALAWANGVTAPKIAEARRAMNARAVRKIFPSCRSPREEKVKVRDRDVTVYRCPAGNVAFTFSTKMDPSISAPYSGEIKIMLGVDRTGTIKGIQVVSHSETPGLGANITEPWFLKQFVGLKLTSGKWAVKKDDPAGLIDAISGATISSRAMTTMVRAALTFYEKKIRGRSAPSRRSRFGKPHPIRPYVPPEVTNKKPNTRPVMVPPYLLNPRNKKMKQYNILRDAAIRDIKRRARRAGADPDHAPAMGGE